MQLILNGGGAGNQASKSYEKYSEIIDKNKPVLYIPLAWKNEDYDGCLEWLKNELKPYEIKKFDMITNVSQFDNIKIDDYSSIFIGGGNTYKLLMCLKESRGYEIIDDYIKNKNGIIFGGSAGAIIFGKDISTCNICSNDENKWPNLNTKGFNVVDGKSLACHYATNGKKEIHDSNIELYQSKGYDILTLTEEQSVYINNGDKEIIDNKKDSILK